MSKTSSERSDTESLNESIPRWYRLMRLSRRFEQIMEQQAEAGNVPGPLHLSIGQEAVAVGACASLRKTDVITSTHRGHHHCVAKGGDIFRMMAELLGRVDGYSRGRSGSMHLVDTSIGLLGTNGVVGGGIPIATGAAFGMQVLGRDDVAVCFFGEGAAATGGFSESLNVASLWKLPVIFLCENNQYVEMTPQSVHVAGEIWRRAEGYDVPGVKVDGNDVVAVASTVTEAVKRARRGEGPTLVEASTYRWYGHFSGDKAAFREAEEVEAGRANDALEKARAYLAPTQADEIDADVEREIQAALELALKSPVVGPDSISIGHLKAV
jgi:TPP-dependent pyruvate/acetoin dehydrogenase alpha subunit